MKRLKDTDWELFGLELLAFIVLFVSYKTIGFEITVLFTLWVMWMQQEK